MRAPSPLLLDSRRAADLLVELLSRRSGYVPEWTAPANGKGPDFAIASIWARYLETILQRLNQAPEKNKLAFLELLGIELIPAQSARAPVVFRLGDQAPQAHLPAGAQVAAPPPPEGTEQVVFETERGLGLTPSRIQQLVSLWPGRDQYIDHSEAFLTGEKIRPFQREKLEDTPHILYLAHDTLLALAGRARVEVEFELSQFGNEALDLMWEYWDGNVWRGFRHQHPECAELIEAKLDGTAGLTRSGIIQLDSDCAESVKRAVDGIESCWIRAKLDEPLPLDPDQVLPEATQLRLSTILERSAAIQAVKPSYQRGATGVRIYVYDSNGIPLDGVVLELPDVALRAQTFQTGSPAVFAIPPATTPYRLDLSLGHAELSHHFFYRPEPGSGPSLKLEVFLDLGLQPDAALADAQTLDTSAPFYPFGQNPLPGSVFYFTSEEIMTKPGAVVTIQILRAPTPQDAFNSDPLVEVTPEVSWEYWNGREWFPLGVDASDDKIRQLAKTGLITLVIPNDIAPVELHGQEQRWIRVRILKDAFGYTQTITFTRPSLTTTTFVPQPPALADFRLSYTWQHGPFHAEHVLAYNDFHYDDFTEEARWPSRPFQPIQQVKDVTPALYLGFDQPLPVDRMNLYFDLLEEQDASDGPALIWSYWNGFDWQPLLVEDETCHLTHPGMVSFIGPADAAPRARFGTELHWLRASLAEDGLPRETEIHSVHPNAVWASQWQTITDEALGSATGRANEVLVFRRIPVLAGQQLEVQELAGPRANVEWRLLAMEVLGEDYRRIQQLEKRLGQEGPQKDIVEGELRFKRDRRKKVSEVWVRWRSRRHLFASGENDRHYVLERARGRVIFGDGARGKLLPAGARVEARHYRSGGGATGNVATGAIQQPLAGVAGVESVFNPRPAEGGSDAETLEALGQRGPHSLRSRGRAVTPGDWETLAREASAAVAVARVLPGRDPHGSKRPGWVTIVILPRSEERRPWPSFGLREKVRRALERRAGADLAAAHQIHVTGPDYQPVGIEAEVVPIDFTTAGPVEERVKTALERFLHPLHGGPEGQGFDLGRHVFLSDVAALLEQVEGVDYVRDLALFLDGRRQGEQARVAADQVAVAGDFRVKLVRNENGASAS